MEKKEKFSLKDYLFHRGKIVYLASLIKKNYPDFKDQDFIDSVMSELEVLELKQRIVFIAKNLYEFLPKNYLEALEILKKSVPETPDLSKIDDDFGDFIFAPYGFYVAEYGCQEKYLDISLQALAYFTQFFSSEWPIRRFYNMFPEETYIFMKKCAQHQNYHVRRFASEGSRPMLPWGEKIDFAYEKNVEILETLFSDSTRYVVRSVANHLNDISKKNADFAILLLEKWKSKNLQNEKEMDFLIKHALRNLIKSGHTKALELIGISSYIYVENTSLSLETSKIILGEKLMFCFEGESLAVQDILLDYVIYFKTQQGFGKKVFKGFRKTFQKGEKIIFQKEHKIQEMSTRKMYEGEHKIAVYLNGNLVGEEKFELFLK